MNLNYMDFYQSISPKTVARSTLTFLRDFRSREWEDMDEKQRILNKTAIQSAINHQAVQFQQVEPPVIKDEITKAKAAQIKAFKDQADVTLQNAAIGLRTIIEELELIEIKILVVVSDNADRDNLTPGQEIKELKKKLNPEHNPIFKFEVLLNADIHGLISKMTTFEPNILHFTGHGEQEGIYLSKEDSPTSTLMTNETFIHILKHVGHSLYVIFLNSCKSALLADQIHEVRDNIYIIAYKDNIELEMATKVSTRFYRRLYETKLFKSAINLFSSETEKGKNPHMERTIEEKLHLKMAVLENRYFLASEEIHATQYEGLFHYISVKLKPLFIKIKSFFKKTSEDNLVLHKK